MADKNIKSIIFAVLFGFLCWLLAYIIMGFAFFDYTTNQPIPNLDMGLYITLLVINMIITIAILALYLWKYEQNHPILADKWILDSVVLGLIICGINFLLDAIFFGMMGRDLIAYFFLETTTGYMYPLIILETMILAYIIYGKNS